MDEDWAFAKKFTEFSDNNDENEKSNELSDLEIFQVKFLGSTTVDAPKSEKVTANAIKSIITTAKGKVHSTLDQKSNKSILHFDRFK